MELIPIGQAADRLGLNPSALRYYDERGLVSPQARRAGRRMYGPDELRRLAFIKIAQRLGLPLDTAAAVLDAPGSQWREIVLRQIAELDQMIAQAQGAQLFLTHALNCPADHPAREMRHDDRGAEQARRRNIGRSTRRRAHLSTDGRQ